MASSHRIASHRIAPHRISHDPRVPHSPTATARLRGPRLVHRVRMNTGLLYPRTAEGAAPSSPFHTPGPRSGST